eukprot:scaffold4049_cov76-Cylindrotheca_fusiformis.AAC.6
MHLSYTSSTSTGLYYTTSTSQKAVIIAVPIYCISSRKNKRRLEDVSIYIDGQISGFPGADNRSFDFPHSSSFKNESHQGREKNGRMVLVHGQKLPESSKGGLKTLASSIDLLNKKRVSVVKPEFFDFKPGLLLMIPAY